MPQKINTVICADTVVDGIFDRSLVIIPVKFIFQVKVKETKFLIYENNPGGPNPFLGDVTLFMS